MSLIAIIGAGAIGGAVARKLAERDRVREVRLIDVAARVAQGKALDIQQSSPVECSTTRMTSAGSIDAAAGADVIVIADAAADSAEHSGEAGLALLRKLTAIESTAPIVCAGATQRELIARSVTELHIPGSRVLGSAPFALESALRTLAGLALDGSGTEVSLKVVGVPPNAAVVAWEEASAFGQPLGSLLPPHEIRSLAARIPGLWPPGPYVLASAAARVVEAIAHGSRRRYSCFVTVSPGRVTSMPAELGQDGIIRVVEPALTRQERTMMENAIDEP